MGKDNTLSMSQQLSLWARKLVIHHVGLPLEIVYSSKGKPFFKNNSDIHFSISHTSDYIAIALANKEIGIDIEHLRQHKQDVAMRFFSAKESDYLFKLPQHNFDTAFTKLWTLKEAYAKCISDGISGTFSSTTIDLPSLSIEGKEQDFSLTSLFDKTTNLFIAICLRNQ